MGSQLPAGGQGGLTPEAIEAIRQLGMQAQAPQAPTAATMPNPAAPAPAQAPAQPGGGWMDWLMNLFSPSTQSLAGQQPAMTAPMQPMGAQDLAQYAIDQQAKRQAPPQ